MKEIVEKPVNLPTLSCRLVDLHRRLDNATNPNDRKHCLHVDFGIVEAKRCKLQIKTVLLHRARSNCQVAFRYACERRWPGFLIQTAAE